MDAFQLSPIEWVVILTSLTSGAIGAVGIGSYLYYRDRNRLKQRRASQQHHLEWLQRLTSKLLNALDRLVGGLAPEETILYQRFEALGGEYYADTQSTVYENLRHCQSALAAAFDLHQKLIDPGTVASRPLEQRLWDWEMLYATLIGSGDEIQNLTGDELHSLLDPLGDSNPEAVDSDLAGQLEALRRELAGQPLKVRWQEVYPARLQAEGILDYIHRIKLQLAGLAERHKKEAPFWLVEARTQRLQAEKDVPTFLPELYRHLNNGPDQAGENSPTDLAVEELFRDIDMRLAETEAAQTMGRFLEVIERSHSIWQDMDILRGFLQAIAEHGRRLARQEAITAQGYRPPTLAADLTEIKVDVQTITGRLHSGDYMGASAWIEELETDSWRALAATQDWQALHYQNVAEIKLFQAHLAQAAQWWAEVVAPAWEQMQSYASPNWSDLPTEFERVSQAFEALQQTQCAEIESLNSLEVQQLVEAERLLVYARADLVQVEHQGQLILNRLAEIRAAEQYLPDALRLTWADLKRAEALRDQEDAKIGPEVDRQIEQAREHLAEAERLAEAGEFLAAAGPQARARQLATAAYVSANEQVRQIEALLSQLAGLVHRVEIQAERGLIEAQQLSAVARTASTGRLARQLQATLAKAEQTRLKTGELEDRALARTLETAVATYEQAGQQSEWLLQQVAADRAEYDEVHNQTLVLLAEAEAAIDLARQAVGSAETNSAGHRALQRAEALLPDGEDAEQATRATLKRLQEQIEGAHRYARWAESQPDRQSRLARAKHHLHRPEPEEAEPGRPRLKRLSERRASDQQ